MAGMMARVMMANSAGLYPPIRGNGTRRTKARKTRPARPSRKRSSTARSGKLRTQRKRARLVKGSRAAKAYMAKIRRKRR